MTGRQRDRRAVVLFSAQDYWYHNRGHSDLQLARGMARERRVLLVNSIGMRMPSPGATTQPVRRVLRKIRSALHGTRRPEPGLPDLVVMTPVFLPLYGNERARRANARLVSAQVRALLWLWGVRRPDIVVTIPTAADVVQHLPRRSLAVNRADKFSAFDEADQTLIASLERALLRDADVAFYVSHTLMDEERELAGGVQHFLGHGLDVDHFEAGRSAPEPHDLVGLERPLVGFFGGIDGYLVDLDLLRRTADAMERGTLVLIGDPTCDISDLTNHPRVHWLGPRDYRDIPAYGAQLDVLVMPWLDNEWIRYCNPIKAKEYLALGKPVVTTYYPEAEPFGDVMGIAKTPDDFVTQVLRAMDGDGVGTSDARRAAVAGDSWVAKSRELLGLVDDRGRLHGDADRRP